jgi:competence protein ComGC
MKKRVHKLLKHGFLVFLALVSLLLVFTPMPVLSSEPQVVKDATNDTNKVVNEDLRLFCLSALQDRD